MSRLSLALRQISTNILHAGSGRDVLFNGPEDGWEVEQPWLWWMTGNGNGPVVGNPIPGANGVGYGGLPAVDRATRLICGKTSSLPWHVYRDETERLPTPAWVSDPQALRLDGRIVDTSGMIENRLSKTNFWFEWQRSCLWWGDGFVYVPTRDAYGAPKPPLWLLHPEDVEIRDGRYWVSDIELAPGSVIHLMRTPIIDGRGTGVFRQFAADFGMASAVRDYASSAFTAGVPAGYLQTTTPNISQDQADALKARWMSQHGNTRRSIAVLNATTSFHALSWDPVSMAAVDFSKVAIQQVANAFNIPAYLLGAPTDSNTYANVESRMTEYYQLSLHDWIRGLEAVLDSQLPLGTELRVEIDGLLRADTKTRFDVYEKALNNGIYTVDEVRRLENRPPMAPTEGAEVL